MKHPLPIHMLQAFYTAFPELAETPIEHVAFTGFQSDFPLDAVPVSRDVYACGTSNDGKVVPVVVPGLVPHREVKVRLMHVPQNITMYPYYVRKTVVRDQSGQEWTRCFWQPWKRRSVHS